MNYFAHGHRFVHDPYFLVGTAIPDLLNVVDRRVRVRNKQSQAWIDDADACVQAVARGICQHHHDDDWFHRTTAFVLLTGDLTREIRNEFPSDDSPRAGFLGHILIELLLDAQLIAESPQTLEQYYAALEGLDPVAVQSAVECMSGKSVPLLHWFLPQFCEERFLWHYTADDTLCFRLNQVLRRVGLPQLPPEFAELMPRWRELIAARRDQLLTPESPAGH